MRSESISMGGYSFWKSTLLALVCFSVAAILTRGGNSQVLPSVIERVSVFVVGVTPHRNLNSLHRVNHPVNTREDFLPPMLNFHSKADFLGMFLVPVEWDTGISSRTPCVKPLPSVVPFEMGSRPYVPGQDSSFLVVREALLQILPRGENDGQFHNQLVDCGIRRIWEPNTPRCAAYFSERVTKFNT